MLPAEISVSVVLKRRAPDGVAPDSAGAAASLDEAVLPDGWLEKAVAFLEGRGFRVSGQSQSTLSFRGSPDAFNRTFGTRLTTRVISAPGSGSEVMIVEPAPGLALKIPEELEKVIAVVEIQTPNLYMSGGGAAPAAGNATSVAGAAPSATPPTTPGYYLDVLDDVPRLLNAHKVHAQGATGAGVRVAMIDSGFDHRHPFFVAKGFTSKVVLAVPAIGYDTHIDARGHGTGESANLFAVAPGVDFVGVKLDGDKRGDPEASLVEGFQAALALRPLPKVISCSVMLPGLPWTALVRVIADALAKDIAVVACAGNGNYGFPAQIPEVIAAGGVFVAKDGSPQASNFSSAFTCIHYAGRNVPDCCGLVGQSPRAAYIMLPVPPGSTYDKDCATPDADGHPGDGTAVDDGWALFSGTSAAAPQLAAVCALLLEKNPSLKPDALKSTLMSTADGVSHGSSSASTGGHKATSARPNLATGMGLVNAHAAWQAA